MAGFEVAIQGGGQTLQRAWTSAELEAGVGWLKRMNARGHDIAIRPAGEHGLVLVAGLTGDGVARMAAAGWTPAATIETSPGRYEAWVKLSEKPLEPVVRAAGAVYLSQSYGGDPPRDQGQASGAVGGLHESGASGQPRGPPALMCWRTTVRARSRPRRRRSWRGSKSSGGKQEQERQKKEAQERAAKRGRERDEGPER